MLTRHVRHALLALSLLALVSGAGLAATGPPEPTREKFPPSDGANFTVVPETAQDHQPGYSSATYTMFAKGAGPWNESAGLAKVDFYKITSQQSNFSQGGANSCSATSARAFGIDRENDDPGTKTDDNLLDHMEANAITEHAIVVDIYEESDLGGNPTYLNDTDETVAKLADCIQNEGPAGWYQFIGYVNGTNYEGEYQEVTLFSTYFYICDCESREEAVEKLGPPPYTEGNVPTRTATPAEGTPTPRVTATTTSTATATVAPAVSSTPTADGAREDATTATATAAAAGPAEETRTRTARATAPPAASATGVPTTPTFAQGPGFTALSLVVATLLGGVTVLRRRGD